jgi:hypothetical protein
MRTHPLALALFVLAAPVLADDEAAWQDGAALRSAGALTFGADGVLFVGDAEGASVVALETGDTTPAKDARDLDVEDLTGRIAQLTGASADQIEVHDLAVNPLSGRAYQSVTRGGGADALALLVRVNGPDDLEVLELSKLRSMRLDLADAPAPGGSGRSNQRALSVTDLGFHDGMLYVAGLSNEEFASKLRVFAFPFDGHDRGTNVEVFHGNHGRWETRSPIRTFLSMSIDGEPHLLAGYTCTPLVTFPLKALTPDAKLRGKTVAELGNRNTPLDMVLYEKEGAQYLLIANSARGVMKVSTAGLAEQAAITTPVEDKAGLTYETLEDLTHVTQLARLDARRALVLVENAGRASLRAVDLP